MCMPAFHSHVIDISSLERWSNFPPLVSQQQDDEGQGGCCVKPACGNINLQEWVCLNSLCMYIQTAVTSCDVKSTAAVTSNKEFLYIIASKCAYGSDKIWVIMLIELQSALLELKEQWVVLSRGFSPAPVSFHSPKICSLGWMDNLNCP